VDAIDRKILAELQVDGRLSITELAAKVGLSLSPCHRRLRELERARVITGYRASIDPEAVGLSFEALVFVTMRQEDRDTLLGFEQAVARIPNVLLAQRLFGNPDYLLRVGLDVLGSRGLGPLGEAAQHVRQAVEQYELVEPDACLGGQLLELLDEGDPPEILRDHDIVTRVEMGTRHRKGERSGRQPRLVRVVRPPPE